MKFKTFILTFLMMMSCSISFGQELLTGEAKTESKLKQFLYNEDYGTITIGDDFSVSSTIEIPKGRKITIDLNGHKLTTNADIYIFKNFGRLTITDNSTDGKGTISSLGIYNGKPQTRTNTDDIDYTAQLTIKGGVFENISQDGGAAIYNHLGVIDIQGGEFYGEYSAITNFGLATIANAYIECLNRDNDAAAIINDFEIEYGNNVNVVGRYTESGTASITDGEATYLFAELNGTKYPSLQAALDACTTGDINTINLLFHNSDNATVSQKEGVNITIDGNGYKDKQFEYTGTICVHGNSRHTGTETLTIQDINFTTENDSHDFILCDFRKCNEAAAEVVRYAHNVTVQNCNFTATEASEEVVALRFRQSYNINVVNSKFTNLHSAMWATGTSGIAFDNITATNCKEGGISVGTSTPVSVNKFIMEGEGAPQYGVRADGSGAYSLTVANSTLEAEVPVIVRNTTGKEYNLTVAEDVTLTATNGGPQVVVTADSDDVPYVAPTVKVNVTLNNDASTFGLVAKIGNKYYSTLDEAFAVATEGQTITLLGDATPALTSQSAITKAAVIDLNDKTLTLDEGDLYFGTTEFKNGNIIVDPSVEASTAVFWMFENQTLTFDNVNITATGVTGTYLIGINGGTGSAVNLLNNSSIIIDNESQAGLTAVICDNGTNNNVKIENSTIDVKNIEGRFYLGGTQGDIVVDNTDITLNGVKEGFYLRANQTLSIEGESEVEVVLNDTNNRYGINITDYSATYTKDDLATVNATVYDPVVRVKNLTELQTALVENVDKPIFATETIVISEGTLELDLNTRRVFAAGKNVIRNDGATLTIKNGTIERVGDAVGYAFNNAQGALNITGTTIKGGLYTSGTSLVATNANISHFQSTRHTIYAYNCNVTLNGGTYHNDNSGNATIMAAGSSVVTIKDGTFSIKDGRQESGWTSCLTDTQNTASITVEGGTFNGGFRVQTGTTMTIEGGSFNDCYGSNYNIYGTAVVKGGTFTDANAINFAKGNLAEGYVASDNGNGTFTVLKGVAKIGDTYYATLQEAINASQDNDEIVLLDNVTDVDATISKKVTLNLNEKTITDAYIIITSEVNIKGGSIKNVNEPYPLVVQNGGKLTVDGVGIKASKSDRAIWVRSGSELVFNNSSILATKGEGNNKTNLIAAIYTDSNTDVTINSGTITVDTPDNKAVAIYGNYENANVTVNGGKISTSGKNYSYGINVNGDITVTGGEIVTNEKGYAYPSGIRYGYNYALVTATGNVTITGGSITTNGHSGYAVNVGRTYSSNDQTVSITGGTFTNNLSEVEMTTGHHNAPVLVWTGTASTVTATIENGNFSGYSANLFRKDNGDANSTLEVSGGTFDREINGEYLAKGYAITANENGTYGVSLASYVVLPEGVTAENYKEKFGDNTVTDGTNYYATMTAALNAVYGTETTLYCKPGANVGQMTHGAIKETLTVYGNDAYTSGNGDFDIGNCNYEGKEITSDITLTVKHLDGCGAWGYKNTEHTINIVFENCKDMSEVYLSGTAGRTNITMTNCEFTDNVDGGNCKVYSNADGTITLKDMLFSGVDKAVNFNHKSTGTQTIALENCTFTNCGDDVAGDEIPVRVLSSVAGGNSVLTVTDCTFSGTPEGGADILLDYGVGLTEATVSNTAAKVVVEKENNVGETTIVAANETKSFVNLVPVAKIGDAVYYTFEDAIAAAVADASITSIEILRDYTQTYYIEAGKTYSILENQNLTVVAPEGKSYTITLDRTIGETFSIYQKSANSSLTIADNVTIEGLDILANGFATSGNNTNINGTLKAMSLKQWTSNGTITVSETGKVWLGYGDGQFDLANGNGAVVINGNGDKTEAQFKAGYSGTRGNGNTLTLNDTYFEAGAWFNLNGSNGTININNSLLKVSGGDAAGKMTIKAGNVVYVNEGGTLECANITLEEGATIVVNGGTLKATTLTNNGTVVVSGESTLNIQTLTGESIKFLDGAIINNSTVGGNVFVAGDVTFRGDNTFAMLYDYGTLTDYYGTTAPMKWNVEKGASVTLTEKARYGLGYGDEVTVIGNIENALTARENLSDDDRSLFMHGLVAQESSGWNCNSKLTVKNAYVVLGSNNSFGNKPGNYGGTYKFDFNNSVVDGSRITFYEANSQTEFTLTNSNVRIGTFMTRDADSKFILTGSKVLSTAETNGNDEGNYNAGELVLNNSSLTYNAAFTNTGVLNIGENSNVKATTVINNGTINFTSLTSILETATEGLVITLDSNYPDHKVVYKDGKYQVVEKDYVAQIGEQGYETLAEAATAAQDGETIQLLWEEGDAAISMAATFVGNKTVTIKGTADVDWSKGWFFVGRGGEGDGHVIFDNAILTSVSYEDNTAYGINVSGRKKGSTDTYNGTVEFKNSTVVLDYLIQKNVMTLDNSTLTVKNGCSLTGRLANETENGELATSTTTLNNGSKLVVNGQNGMDLGYEGYGVLNIDANSTFEATENYGIAANGTMNVNGGNVKVAGKLTNNGTMDVATESNVEVTGDLNVNGTLNSAGNITANIVKAPTATIQLTGGIYTTEPQDGWCAESYGAFPYDENSWVVREISGTQTIALQAGWNWMSSYISTFDGEGGLQFLEEELGANGVQIKNNKGSHTNGGDQYDWYGTLKSVSVKDMYKVNVVAAQEINYQGSYVNYDECVIPLYIGWNYIGYPVNEEMPLADALANLDANAGDVIKSQNATAIYTKEDGWVGFGLDILVPGEGYMYQNTSNSIKELSYTTKKTNTSTDSNSRSSMYWTVDATQYPSNMTMIAMTDVEGGDYEVAAFVNGELRGSSRPIYVESLNAHILVLTISGDDVEEITFKYYDITTGEETKFSNRINYTNDAIVGSMDEPYMLTRGTTGIGEAAMSQVNIYPNPTTTGTEINLQTVCDTVEVFNALGVKVAEYQNVDSIDALETAGIYVIRITNNGNVQNCRLVVK